jgi:tellurite resistance protein TehA-like permease
MGSMVLAKVLFVICIVCVAAFTMYVFYEMKKMDDGR